jgi:hypothetical protein
MNQHFPFQGPQKYTQIWIDFWYENEKSGKPFPVQYVSLNLESS